MNKHFVSGRGKALSIFLLFGSLVFLFYPGLSAHIKNGCSLRFFQDDMLQQVIPYLRYYDLGTFNDYYAGDYFIACMPLGFHALFRTVASVMNPVEFALHLPYVLYGLFLLGMGRAAFRLGGWSCCWLVLAFCLCADVYLDRMSGGLARAFGFPIIGLGLAALVQGRLRMLMVVIIGGALFYPSAAVPLGMAMAVLLFICPACMRGEAEGWSFKKRFILLACTGGFAAAFILPTALRIAPYGPSVTPHDVADFPESGPGGRYQEAERAPFPGFFIGAKKSAPSFLFTLGRFSWERSGYTGKPFFEPLRKWAFEKNYKGVFKRKDRFLPVLYCLALLGGLGMAWRSRAGRVAWLRLLLLPLCAGLAYQIARVAAPYFYMPERYVAFPVPPFMALFIASGLCGLPAFLGKRARPWHHAVLGLLLGGLFMVTFGGRGSERAGLYRRATSEDQHLYASIDDVVSKEKVIAGWPNKAINYMALFTHRTPFLTFEIHQAFHQAYALEMRERMEALMPAYFAIDFDAVHHLRDAQHVDVLLLDQRDFQRRPDYFNPFGEEMARLFKTQASASWAFWGKQDEAILLRSGSYVLIDLQAL